MTATLDVGSWLTADSSGEPCGVFPADQAVDPRFSVPLQSRHVEAVLHCDLGFAEVTEELSYLSDHPCSATFRFPLPSRAAVFKFQATIGDRKIITATKRKEEAQQEYDDNVDVGHTAVLAKQVKGSIFSVDLGNLEPHTEAIVRLTYLRRLDRAAGTLEFVHTATWVPPYFTAEEASQGVQQMAESNPVSVARVSYTLSYAVTVVAPEPPLSIVSPSHDDALIGCTDDNGAICITSKQDVSASLDFVLMVELPEKTRAAASRLRLQTCGRGDTKKTVAQATFLPQLLSEEAGLDVGPREVWLVIDGSGSMSGSPAIQARDAASFMVKDLTSHKGIMFNIVMFGSAHTMMWPQAKDATPTAAAEAERWIQDNCNGNWGGTEILQCLKAVWGVPVTSEHTRQVIFMTDGGVSSSEEGRIKHLVSTPSNGIIAAATRKLRNLMPGTSHAKNSDNDSAEAASVVAPQPSVATVMVLGIGHGVHRSFLNETAELSGGVAAFVVNGEDVAVKAGFLAKCALSVDALSRPRIVAKGCEVELAPVALPPRLFPGEPLTVLAQVTDQKPGASLALVAVKAAGGELRIELPLDDAPAQQGEALAVLHAMCSIGSLLDGRSRLHLKPDGSLIQPPPSASAVEDAVVALAVQENLVTPHTSSVGILTHSNPLDTREVVRHEIPLQVPLETSTGQLFRQSGQFGGAQVARPMCYAPPGGMSYGEFCIPQAGGARVARCRAAPRKNRQPAIHMMAPLPRAAPAPTPVATLAAGSNTLSASSTQFRAQAKKAGGLFSTGFLFGSRARNLSRGQPEAEGLSQAKCSSSSSGSMWSSSSNGPPAAEAAAASGGPVQEIFMSPSADSSLPDFARVDKLTVRGCELVADAGGAAERRKEAAPVQAESQVEEAKETEQAVPNSRAMLRQLNLLRREDGSWRPSRELLALLQSFTSTPDLMANKPSDALSDTQWATVLALALLRARLASGQPLWASWDAAAVAWLKQGWPTDPAVRGKLGGVGAAVLCAMKLM